MEKKSITIESPLSQEILIKEFQKAEGKAGIFGFNFISNLIQKKMYVGEISIEKIELQTLDTPPIEIKGNITQKEGETILNLEFKYDSSIDQEKAFIYALGYPIIAIGIMLSIYNNPTSILTYILSLLSLSIPYLIHKWESFGEKSPNPDYVIDYILESSKGKIIT